MTVYDSSGHLPVSRTAPLHYVGLKKESLKRTPITMEEGYFSCAIFS